ncbi:DUF1992 domain-containing protein, partial [Kineococcus sp. R8]|uniref:DnaJ family domain-containing protein n=1 Tax=Kineococcus siccus TaxID=2696567 RepID=UPI0014133643|nr:DUF1992 domain-containing protein [Kineococcus siccus]
MSGRKPASSSFGDWVERQVREAQERGEFDDLPGAGKPLRGLDRPWSPEDWAIAKARSEDLDLTALLPPGLAFRKEREQLREQVGRFATEAALREVVEDFNTRLRAAYRRPAEGPPLVVALLDADDLLARWRELRPPPRPATPVPP